jgi:hypothetical protein
MFDVWMFMVDGGALKGLGWMMVYFAGSEVDGDGYLALVGLTCGLYMLL